MDALQEHIKNQSARTVDSSKPFITITKFKRSGKWYSTDVVNIEPENITVEYLNGLHERYTHEYQYGIFIVIAEGYNFDVFFHYLYI